MNRTGALVEASHIYIYIILAAHACTFFSILFNNKSFLNVITCMFSADQEWVAGCMSLYSMLLENGCGFETVLSAVPCALAGSEGAADVGS